MSALSYDSKAWYRSGLARISMSRADCERDADDSMTPVTMKGIVTLIVQGCDWRARRWQFRQGTSVTRERDGTERSSPDTEAGERVEV